MHGSNPGQAPPAWARLIQQGLQSGHEWPPQLGGHFFVLPLSGAGTQL